MNESLHSIGTFLLHLVGNVAVNIQRESCGSVPQVALNRFYVVSGLECSDCVRVPHIVEPNIRAADPDYNFFEVIVDSTENYELPLCEPSANLVEEIRREAEKDS